MAEPSIHLRELQAADLPLINVWRNDRELVGWLGANFHFIAPAVDERWYQRYLDTRDQHVRLAILAGADGPFVGLVNLTGIHPINRTAEFSILIGNRDYWSRGLGTQAIRLMLRHGFEDLNLNRIYLTVLASNPRARRAYERAGFVVEGTERQAVYKDGRYHDMILMAVLRAEHLAQP